MTSETPQELADRTGRTVSTWRTPAGDTWVRFGLSAPEDPATMVAVYEPTTNTATVDAEQCLLYVTHVDIPARMAFTAHVLGLTARAHLRSK